MSLVNGYGNPDNGTGSRFLDLEREIVSSAAAVDVAQAVMIQGVICFFPGAVILEKVVHVAIAQSHPERNLRRACMFNHIGHGFFKNKNDVQCR